MNTKKDETEYVLMRQSDWLATISVLRSTQSLGLLARRMNKYKNFLIDTSTHDKALFLTVISLD